MINNNFFIYFIEDEAEPVCTFDLLYYNYLNFKMRIRI